MTLLKDLAHVIRSKNSGPFEITFDVMFPDADGFRRARDSGVLNARKVCELYGVPEDDIVALMFFEPALAFKLTLKRKWAQGSVNERDTFGAQQHVPLMTIDVP